MNTTTAHRLSYPVDAAHRYLVETMGRHYGLEVVSEPLSGDPTLFNVLVYGDKRQMTLPAKLLSQCMMDMEEIGQEHYKSSSTSAVRYPSQTSALIFTHLNPMQHKPLTSLIPAVANAEVGETYEMHLLDEDTAFLTAQSGRICRGLRNMLQASDRHKVVEYQDVEPNCKAMARGVPFSTSARGKPSSSFSASTSSSSSSSSTSTPYVPPVTGDWGSVGGSFHALSRAGGDKVQTQNATSTYSQMNKSKGVAEAGGGLKQNEDEVPDEWEELG